MMLDPDFLIDAQNIADIQELRDLIEALTKRVKALEDQMALIDHNVFGDGK